MPKIELMPTDPECEVTTVDLCQDCADEWEEEDDYRNDYWGIGNIGSVDVEEEDYVCGLCNEGLTKEDN